MGALTKEIKRWGGCYGRPIDSIYIGGGTPSLIGERIIDLIKAVRESFEVSDNAEITAEMNPTKDGTDFLNAAKKAGVNRLSIGVQSGDDKELRVLGRSHTAKDAMKCFEAARKVGFRNISLDIMLGLPESNLKTLSKSIDFLLEMRPEHISAYILKIEPNTRFGKEKPKLPDDDQQAEQYLYLCKRLEDAGYGHYEISNFAKMGFESRHNLKYWECKEYLGIGPAAHSFIGNERFFYERNLKKFIENPETVFDGKAEETDGIMLGLRLKKGVDLAPHQELKPLLDNLVKAKLATFENGRFCLTDEGMLVSNSIITEITEQMK